MTNPVLTALRKPTNTALVAAAGLVVIAGLGQLAPPRASDVVPPQKHPLASSELVCAMTLASGTASSTVSAGVAPLDGVTTGLATLANLSTSSSAVPRTVITSPGVTVTRHMTIKTRPPLLARAQGSFAVGYAADQELLALAGPNRGLGTAPCTSPATDTWLVGGGATLGRTTQVLLVNDDARAAQVDLEIFGPAGPITSTASTGISVAPGGRTLLGLTALAPNARVTAVHVISRVGRVVALGTDALDNGLIPLGMSLLSPTTAGASVVIPAIVAPVSEARLVVLSPAADTTVTIKMVTPDGLVSPAGIDSVDLQAGKVTTVDVRPALAGQTAGFVLTADTPIVAGVSVGIRGSRGFREADAIAPAPALTGPAVVTGLVGQGRVHEIVLTAPAAAATVRLQLVTATSGTAWSTTINVGAGSFSAVRVPVPAAGGALLVVTPIRGGPVYAERYQAIGQPNGSLVSTSPLLPQRTSALVPGVESVPGSSSR